MFFFILCEIKDWKMKRKTVLLIILCLVEQICFAQVEKRKIDSILRILPSLKSDSNKVNTLIDLSVIYRNSSLDKALKTAKEAKILAAKIEYKKGLGYALKAEGIAYNTQGKFLEALESNKTALKVFDEAGIKVGSANMLNNIGVIYYNKGDEAKALECYLKSLKLSEEIHDTLRIATALSNIGAVYSNKESTRLKAVQFHKRALVLGIAINNKELVGNCFANIGEIFVSENKLDSALIYEMKAKEVYTGSMDLPYILNVIGKVYRLKKNYELAIKYHQQAFDSAKVFDAKLDMAQALFGTAETLKELKNYTSAIKSYGQAETILNTIGLEESYDLEKVYAGLSYSYSQLKDYENAYKYQSLLLTLKEKIYNLEVDKKLETKLFEFEIEKKQGEINLQDEVISKQKLIRNAFVGGFLLVLLLIGVVYNRYRIKQKSNAALSKTLTELKETQAHLVQSEKMASLGQLTAGVAHEINNPINFVSSNLKPLKRNFEELIGVITKKHELSESDLVETIAETNQLLIGIEDGANRTIEIVKGLRNFSRHEENEKKKANINEGIESTLLLKNNLLTEKNIEVEKSLGTLPEVECFAGEMNQVFMNIISNAIEAIGQDGKINIATSLENKHVKILIKDSGRGMTDEIIKKIFDPFFTTKDVGKGTGLGLSVSYGIIEKHHGKIEVRSEAGIGSEFLIWLPVEGLS